MEDALARQLAPVLARGLQESDDPVLEELAHSLLTLGASLGSPALSGAPEPPKRSQGEVSYTDTSEYADEACGLCAHFQGPSGCELVEGEISPEGWCELFTTQSDDGQSRGVVSAVAKVTQPEDL